MKAKNIGALFDRAEASGERCGADHRRKKLRMNVGTARSVANQVGHRSSRKRHSDESAPVNEICHTTGRSRTCLLPIQLPFEAHYALATSLFKALKEPEFLFKSTVNILSILPECAGITTTRSPKTVASSMEWVINTAVFVCSAQSGVAHLVRQHGTARSEPQKVDPLRERGER